MFTSIVDTPSKTKLATFFLSALPRSFHSEEIRKALGEPGPTILTHLRFFTKNGFLRTTDRRGEVYYRLNSRYPYSEELRGLLLKRGPGRFRDAVAQELERLGRVNVVVLTGLFSGETSMPTDLVVVGSPNLPAFRRAVEAIEKELRLSLNYTIFSDQEFEERVNMYEKFTRDLFDNAHIMLLDRRTKPSKTNLTRKNDKKVIKTRK